MQIHITLDHNDGPETIARIMAAIAGKEIAEPALTVQSLLDKGATLAAAQDLVNAEAVSEQAMREDPLPPGDNVGAKADPAAEPEKKKAPKAAKTKEPEKPAIDSIACREALKKVAAKAGDGDAAGGVAKVEQILGNFNAKRISDLQPDQWGPFIEICESYLKS